MTETEITLALEKLRAEIDRDRQQAETLMRQRLNWDQQEQLWKRSMLNWESQEKHWVLQNRVLLGTFILGVLGIVSRVFWP